MANRHTSAHELTKREAAAIAALQGILSSEAQDWHYNDDPVIARKAVLIADKLFDELEADNGQ